jgi:heparan-alpha-glucosaminide N-acetyltransferase
MTEPQSNPPLPVAPATRFQSIDAYRGFVMFLMMAEVLHLGQMARNFPDEPIWKFLALQQSHVEWVGCTLHDMIQPSFSFLVGVALPFSIASRVVKGQSMPGMVVHAIWRSGLLIWLGIFLRSVGRPQTRYTFEDTLTQIGLGYFFLFLLGFVKSKFQWLALILILVGYWAIFAIYPAPGPDFDYKAVGVPDSWSEHEEGLASHWNKNSNAAAAFDRWFMNRFPREKPFEFNGGGYSTLSFIPTLGTMILGLIAGTWMRSGFAPGVLIGRFLLVGLILLGLGYGLGAAGICPVVKRIWTPSWVLFSGGWCFIMLAGFYALTDAIHAGKWSWPLRVIGMNSIAAYFIAHAPISTAIESAFRTHLGPNAFEVFGKEYAPLVGGTVFLLTAFLILVWMERRRILIRV